MTQIAQRLEREARVNRIWRCPASLARDSVSVTHSTFTGNSVLPNDGGLSLGGGLRLGASPALVSDSVFRSNSARTGGAIASTGSAPTRIENSTFECNSSDVYGGNALSQGNTFLGC